ncbi:MAG TPA: CPCC family cysteine-rich protein [Polyangiales bacterium]|nr:CPCC family cysteine-rich protein [Polyangiales bacterium]
MTESRLRAACADCPCCGYRTLPERGGYDICILCFWEDNGSDDINAGGPNRNVSLAEARANFCDHLTMYPVGKDTRIGGVDSALMVEAKRKIIAAFDALRSGADVARAWEVIEHNEAILEAEHDRRIAEYEAAHAPGRD